MQLAFKRDIWSEQGEGHGCCLQTLHMRANTRFRNASKLPLPEHFSNPLTCTRPTQRAMHAPVSHEEARHTPSSELVTAPAITYWQYGVEGRSTSRSKAAPVRFSWKKVAKGAMKILPLLSQFK